MIERLHVLVASPDSALRSRIAGALQNEPRLGRLYEAADPETYGSLIEAEPHVTFLDLDSPLFDRGSGLRWGGFPLIVACGTKSEQALSAFEYGALDFLQKPPSSERFGSAWARVKRAAEWHVDRGEMGRSLPGRRPGAADGFHDRILVKCSGETLFLRSDEILWFEAEGDYINVHTRDRSYLIRETMRMLEETLDPSTFMRIHRSFIVNLRHIRKLAPQALGEHALWLSNGKELKLGRKFAGKFQARLGR